MSSVLKWITGVEASPKSAKARQRAVMVAMQNHIYGQVPQGSLPDGDGVALDLWYDAKRRAARDAARNAYECERLSQALTGTGLKPIVLKGAAYQMLGLEAGKGRRSSDLDILIAPDQLNDLEKHIRSAGFEDHLATANPYDQAYYRNYMHELPPLVHKVRRTHIDVHHALSPMTARVREKAALMIKASVPLEGTDLLTLSPQDRFLHAALHSLYDDDFRNPLRHMLDLFHLFGELKPREVAELMDRAKQVGLEKPARMALWLLKKCLSFGPGAKAPGFLASRLLLSAVKRGRTEGLTGFLLYCRGHLLRMPPLQLAQHLYTKARRGITRQSQGPTTARQALEEYLR